MANAKRHCTPGQIWHITHRSHKRAFLLKSVKAPRRWLQWFYEAKKRQGVSRIENLQAACRKWVVSGLESEVNDRSEKWMASLAVGSKAFVESMHALMGVSAMGRKPCETGQSLQQTARSAGFLSILTILAAKKAK
ncbi:MAG: hypothetical protein U5L07_09090 [Desulfobacterales bacterium]|nr:hypothetical protein [Desulfobacterales bacterium]